MNKLKLNALLVGIFALITIAISNVIEILDEKIAPIAWFASLFIVLEILYLNYSVIDKKEFETYINETNPYDFDLAPTRYLRWMSVAMIVGLVSTIIIWFDFIFGMISYLIMHICLITAFSGIFSLNPVNYLKEGVKVPLVSLVSWIVLVTLIYIIAVYNGAESLIVIPYVIFLGTMAHYTWYNLSFRQRSTWFNLFPIIASAIFVFSDTMIGNARYSLNKLPEIWFFFIDTTYVINLFFMVNALLFLKPNVYVER